MHVGLLSTDNPEAICPINFFEAGGTKSVDPDDTALSVLQIRRDNQDNLGIIWG